MSLPTPILTTQQQGRRLRNTVIWAIAGISVIVTLDTIDLIQVTSWRSVLSVSSDIIVFLTLLTILIFIKQTRLHLAAWVLFSTGCLYSIITILLLPNLVLSCTIIPLMGMMLALPYINTQELWIQSFISWITTILVISVRQIGWTDGHITLSNFNLLDTMASYMLIGIILLVINQVHRELSENLAKTQQANAALTEARDTLEQTVIERTADLASALSEVETRATSQAELLEQTIQQREVIRALGAPMLPVSDNTLVLPLIGELNAERLESMQAEALAAIERSGAKALILDITGTPVIDQHVGKGLIEMIHALRLMGSKTVIVGVRPEVAQTIVSLGIDFSDLLIAATLREGLVLAMRRS
ncbi:MAG: STAS domain-containing protein [Oscillochloris sp.]|nr:STAS domain-containing protein [Oscillochloris sp.]